MNIDYNMLDKSIGLKFNTQIILGREEVITFLEEHKIYFAELDVSPIEDSKMIYGYNKLGNPVKLGFDGQAIQRIVLVTKTLKTIRYKAVCTYDGHRYNGFQIQKNHNTIQGELTKIISSVNGKDTLVQGASRTDTGVHALNYVFHFDSDKSLSESRWLELLNYQLPNDIHIKSICKTHPLFHSRYDVHMKRYIYKIKLREKDPLKINYEWFIENLDIDRIQTEIKKFEGTHDFMSFCKGSPDDTIRTIYRAEMENSGNEVRLIFEGSGFLRYMIRIMVYALVQIATGKCELGINQILAEKNRNHTKHMAPANGLYLDEITY